MNPDNQTPTGDQTPPSGTDGNTPSSTAPEKTPPATPLKADPPAKTDDNKDWKAEAEKLQAENAKLLAGRDRANQTERDRQAARDNFIDEIAAERYIDKFLKDNATKYPDVTREDLMSVVDPDQMDAEATRVQARLQSHAQKKLSEYEQPQASTQSEDDVKKMLDTERANPNGGSLEKFLATRSGL